ATAFERRELGTDLSECEQLRERSEIAPRTPPRCLQCRVPDSARLGAQEGGEPGEPAFVMVAHATHFGGQVREGVTVAREASLRAEGPDSLRARDQVRDRTLPSIQVVRLHRRPLAFEHDIAAEQRPTLDVVEREMAG